MTPRPHQVRGMRLIGEEFRKGAMAVVAVAPTGSGKSCLGAMMAAEVVQSGKRVAWGFHREELGLQAARTLRAFGLEIGFQGLGKSAPVQLGSYQTWSSRGEMPDCDYFVGDEAHHLGDKVSWERIPAAVKVAGKRLIGLTATPARADGRALPSFDALVVVAQIAEMQALGLLVPLKWRGPSAAMTKGKIAQTPAEAYREEAPGRSAIVFASNRVSAEKYLAEFLDAGIPAVLVMGDMDPGKRAENLAAFDSGEARVLVNVSVATEGYDCPRCDCVILARSCSSPVLLIQTAGRGLRPFPGKTDCLFLDLQGACHTLGRPDAEAHYSLDGTGIVLAADSCPAGERLCKVCRSPLGDEVVCQTCGKDHSPRVPKAVGAPLTDWDIRWDAAKAGTNASAMVKSLAGILHKAAEAARAGKPWRDAAPAMRFKAIFKRAPYAQEYRAARNFLRAAETFEVPQTSMETT
jgi:DNA repair protein RadD